MLIDHIYMSVLEMVLIQLLLAFALSQTCALQFCPHALAPRAGTCASAFHIHLESILGEGQRDPNGKQFAILFLPFMISGVVDRHHGRLSCCPDACLEDTPFEKASLVGGILPSIERGQHHCLHLTHWSTAYRQSLLPILSTLAIFGMEFQQ